MSAGLKLSGLAGLLITWSVTYYNLAEHRSRSEREALNHLETLVRISEEQVFQTFRALDHTLLALRNAYAQRPADFNLRDWLSQNWHLDRSIAQLSIASEEGAVVSVTPSGASAPSSAANHAETIKDFSAHKRSGRDELLISEPAEGAPRRGAFQLSRPILTQDRAFAGVAMISLDSDYLNRFYQGVDLGQSGVITLVGTDGIIRAQARNGHPGEPALLAGHDLFDWLAQSSSGVYRNVSKIDSVPRLFAYRQVRDMPLVVNIGRAQDDVLAGYYETRNTHLIASAGASAALCVLIWLIGVQQNKRQRAESELRARDLQYRLITDNLRQVLFQTDAAGRITFISDAWSNLSGKPPAAALGQRFEQLVEHKHRDAIRAFFDHVVGEAVDLRSCEVQLEPDGDDELWVEVRAYRTESPAGQAVVGTLTDVTQRHDAERRADLAKQELLERQYALDQSAIVAMTDAQGQITYVNDTFCKVSGYDREELIGQNHRILKSGIHPDSFFHNMYRQITNGRVWRGEMCNRAKDGSLFWLDTTIVPKMGHDGSPISYMTIRIDITRRKAVEQALRESQEEVTRKSELLQTALANINQGLSMFDAERRLVVCNSQYAELYGLTLNDVPPGISLKEIIDRRIELGVYGDDLEAANIKDVLNPASDRLHFFQRLKDGRVIEVSRQRMANGGWVTTHKDVTESRRIQSQMQYLARHDVLTGLANRAVFVEEVERALSQTPRRNIAVFIVDLDRFKEINDVFGHVGGDELLKSVAKRIRECTEDSNAVVARLGGDEFAVLQVADGDARESALVLAGRLVERVSEPYLVDNSEAFIGASVGIALAPDCGHDAGRLMRNADLALYRMKADGRNGFRFFDSEMETEAIRRGALALDLERGLKRGEFELHYQPIFDAGTLSICGMEALARWRHPKHGLIKPDDFIPLAEESGAISSLGEWILNKACQDACAWPPEVKVAVNLSPAQFRRGKLLDVAIDALLSSGLAPERLELEITESIVLQKANFAVLHQLRSLGVAIVLDDFGTGYSSLSYVRAFPFDRIKIDKSFIGELANRADCAAIVCAITGLARTLNIMTTAEGVETQEQFELARAAGCTQMQGYLFGRPRLASDIKPMDFGASWGRAA